MLQSFQVLSDPKRMHGVDVLRGIAVIAVVLFHFGRLPYGYVGVDLFFVVSGFLVGRPLVRSSPPSISRFIASRAFKIWPSYYAFLSLGTVLAVVLYARTRPDQIISAREAPLYALFIQNYRGTQHWGFDHVWSLCVEEHFYVLLPVSAAVLSSWLGRGVRTMCTVAVLGIASGIAGKALGYHIGLETYAATHNRIDALSWGLLLACAHEARWPSLRLLERPLSLLIGVAIVASAIACNTLCGEWFAKVGFHAMLPVGLVLVLAWARGRGGPLALRFVAYYSYNLYLWHAVLVFAVRDRFGSGLVGLLVYLTAAMSIAIAMTVLVEEPCLRLRDRVFGFALSAAQAVHKK